MKNFCVELFPFPCMFEEDAVPLLTELLVASAALPLLMGFMALLVPSANDSL